MLRPIETLLLLLWVIPLLVGAGFLVAGIRFRRAGGKGAHPLGTGSHLLGAKRRFVLLVLCILSFTLVVLNAAAFVLVPVLTGKTAAPVYGRSLAQSAYAEAQAAGAQEWAPAPFGSASALLERALREYRSQQRRAFFRRDFTLARALLRHAESRAREAWREAEANKQNATLRAEKQLARANEMVGISRAFAKLMPLTPFERKKLTRSRLALHEAMSRYRDADLGRSMQLAAEAESLADEIGAACSKRASRYADPRLVSRWRDMIHDTIRWSRSTGKPAVVVRKTDHSLTLYRDGRAKLTYRIDIGTNSVADKRFAGDHATPEGRYRIVEKRDLGQTQYYKALLLDYPNEEDLARFRRESKARRSRGPGLGGDIEIHGEGGRNNDWTRGCVALSNGEMDVLFDAVDVGTPVTIVGGDGGDDPFVALVSRYRATIEKDGS